jgi:hypothetical protein
VRKPLAFSVLDSAMVGATLVAFGITVAGSAGRSRVAGGSLPTSSQDSTSPVSEPGRSSGSQVTSVMPRPPPRRLELDPPQARRRTGRR